MIPSAAEIARSLNGAWLLFRRDPGGLALFDRTARGAWNSFFAAVLVAPLYATLWLLRDTGAGVGAGAATAVEAAADDTGMRFIAVKAIGYIAGWLAFPALAFEVVRLLGRTERYVAFVVATNWAGAIQQGIYLGVGLLMTLGPFPPPVAAMATLAALAVALAYGWFAIRVSLGVPGAVAAGLLALDFALGLIIAGMERGLLR